MSRKALQKKIENLVEQNRWEDAIASCEEYSNRFSGGLPQKYLSALKRDFQDINTKQLNGLLTDQQAGVRQQKLADHILSFCQDKAFDISGPQKVPWRLLISILTALLACVSYLVFFPQDPISEEFLGQYIAPPQNPNQCLFQEPESFHIQLLFRFNKSIPDKREDVEIAEIIQAYLFEIDDLHDTIHLEVALDTFLQHAQLDTVKSQGTRCEVDLTFWGKYSYLLNYVPPLKKQDTVLIKINYIIFNRHGIAANTVVVEKGDETLEYIPFHHEQKFEGTIYEIVQWALSIMHFQEGNYPEAIVALEKISGRTPFQAMQKALAISACKRMNRDTLGAIDVLTDIVQIQPDPIAYNNLAVLEYGQGNIDLAIDFIQEASVLNQAQEKVIIKNAEIILAFPMIPDPVPEDSLDGGGGRSISPTDPHQVQSAPPSQNPDIEQQETQWKDLSVELKPGQSTFTFDGIDDLRKRYPKARFRVRLKRNPALSSFASPTLPSNWAGTNFRGQLLPNGTYLFDIRLDGSPKRTIARGELVIKR
ncbi:MAG: hypothetical protein AAF206_04410 [Bacteroidota bacterium]